MPSTQSLLAGSARAAVEAVFKRLAAERALPRLWERDTSLWSRDARRQEAIRQRLGWLTIPRYMAGQTGRLRQVARELLSAGYAHALLLGMGGSSLFAEVCRKTFGLAQGAIDLTILDSTDPTAIRAHQARGPLERLCVVVSSKSGTASEVQALSAYFYEAFRAAGRPAGDHCLAITDAGTPLETRAKQWKFRQVFAHDQDSGRDVGGRFSALTYFGLLPAAMLGLDVDILLARAIAMLDACGPSAPLEGHPAAELAAVLAAGAQTGRTRVTLLTSGALEGFGAWAEQLVAESTGKAGKGLVPIMGEPLWTPASYGRDRLFIELQLAAHPDASVRGHAQALADAGHPVARITWQDRYDLGGEVVRWELATSLLGYLMDLDPFDEPNVQESKDRTKALLAQYASTGRWEVAPPLLQDHGVSVFGSARAGVSSLVELLTQFLQGRRAGDYCAVLSFLPRTTALDHAAAALRERLGRGLSAATMLGFGPRYLHSTGQLYKGGSDDGLFLLLSAQETSDLPVPGTDYTFGILKQAQALGDFEAMSQRQRRILRIDLGADADAGMDRLVGAVEQALESV